MLEKKLQSNFSKQEDQEKFDKLPQQEKEEHIENAQEKAVLKQFGLYLEKGEYEQAKELLKDYEISKKKTAELAFNVIKNELKEGWVNSAIKIKEHFLSENDPEIEEIAWEVFKKRLKKIDIDRCLKIQKHFLHGEEKEEKIKEMALEVMKEELKKEEIGNVFRVKGNFLQEKEGKIKNDPEIEEIAWEVFKKRLKKGKIYGALEIKRNFLQEKEGKIKNDPEIEEIAWEVFKKRLKKIDIDRCLKIQKHFLHGEEKEEKIKEMALEVMKEMLKEGKIDNALTIKVYFLQGEEERIKNDPEINDLEIIEAVLERLEEKLKKGRIDDALEIKEHFLSNYDLSHYPFQLYQSQELIVLQNLSWKDFEKLFGKEAIPDKKYLDSNLTVAENLQNYFANQEKIEKNPEVWELSGEEKYKNILENLKGLKGSVWDEEGNNHEIFSAFQRGAEVFGYEKMFKFIGGYDRHDALFNFDKILKLKEKANLSPEQFFGQILFQVRKDNSQDAYQKLNKIVDRLENVNLEETLNEARQYKDIKSMAQLLEGVKTPQDIFLNWKVLQKFDDIVDLLNKREILEEIREMPPEKKKLKDYIETLVFHPGINTRAVIEFFKNPKTFLQIEEKHAPEAHELKKPSHYTQIPFLPLTAEDLRDAVVEGSLDKIQTFAPAEMYFTAPVNEKYWDLDLKKLIKTALGSRQEKIKGQARHPKKLFAEVNRLLKKESATLLDLLNNKVTLSPEIEKQVKEIIFDKSIGLRAEFRNYRTRITWKSDPEAVVAGNDTECCMPFGSGKNNVYTFNPNCGQFVIQVETQEKGKRVWRTIAQSVLTKDIDIKKPIPEIIKLAQEEHKSMSDFVSDDIIEQQKEVVVCDNIEVRPNIGRNINVLEILYRKFFAEYLKHYATDDNLNNQKFLIGMGYNDLVFGNSIENTFLPVAPVAYSDSTGENVYEVTVNKKNQSKTLNLWATQIFFSEKEKRKEKYPKNIRPLTYVDTLKVSYIEGKAYADNQTLMEYLHNMENGLIAKDIYNTHFNRPNLSLAYEDEKGKMKGYLFAYEGEDEGEKVIYISDLAALPEAKLAGGKLIKAFLQLYKKYYLDKNNSLPLLARAREKTSYQIITKQLNRLGKEIGVKFVLEEIEEDTEGGENMHWVIIRPITTEQTLH